MWPALRLQCAQTAPRVPPVPPLCVATTVGFAAAAAAAALLLLLLYDIDDAALLTCNCYCAARHAL
jgi:hypothetical protein